MASTQGCAAAVALLRVGAAPVADVTLSPLDNPRRADHPSAIAANPKRDEVYTADAELPTRGRHRHPHGPAGQHHRRVARPRRPKGAIPDRLGVSPDGSRLYVAEAGENAVAVVDLRTRRVQGFAPTACYPAGGSVTADGRRLVITNTTPPAPARTRAAACWPATRVRCAARTTPTTRCSATRPRATATRR